MFIIAMFHFVHQFRIVTVPHNFVLKMEKLVRIYRTTFILNLSLATTVELSM